MKRTEQLCWIHTKTISRLGWRISDRRRLANSSSVAPSNRFGLVDGVEHFLLLLLLLELFCDWGDVGKIIEGDVVVLVSIDGTIGDDDDGDETTFITGEIIVVEDVEEMGGVSQRWWTSVSIEVLLKKKGKEKDEFDACLVLTLLVWFGFMFSKKIIRFALQWLT